MGYPLLNFYRIFLIVTIVGIIGYMLFAPNDLDDGGAITFDEYVVAYIPPVIAIVSLLAMIQLIGMVLELWNRHGEDHEILVAKNKMLSEQVRRLEKSVNELNAKVTGSDSPVDGVGKRLD
jgi:hypothetical protein